MKRFQAFAYVILATGIASMGATTLSAADRYDLQRDRQDMRADYRDVRHDDNRMAGLQAEIARDRAQLAEDVRCGRRAAAARDRQELMADQRALDAQMRDVRYDRYDMASNRNDIRHDVRDRR
jgi:hypothetical protein